MDREADTTEAQTRAGIAAAMAEDPLQQGTKAEYALARQVLRERVEAARRAVRDVRMTLPAGDPSDDSLQDVGLFIAQLGDLHDVILARAEAKAPVARG